ncbi:MAG: hypothetical protein N3A54_05320 [Patescibacteria group bacterium]|nr:hypothetical protein [Patescibacteria group bacterium]
MSEILNTTDVCYLPSRGLLYPKDSPLFQKEFIEFRDMTSVEEDIMSNKVLVKKGVAFNKILQNVLIDQSINVMEMTISDRRALLMRLRSNSYGPEYTFNIRCPECGMRQDVTLDLNESLEKALSKVKPIDETLEFFKKFELERLSHDTFKFKSTKGGNIIVFRIGNGYDEYEMFKEDEKRKKSGEEYSGLVLNYMRRFILSIDDSKEPREVLEKIRALPAMVNHHFRLIYHEVSCDFDMMTNFVCQDPDCQYSLDIEAPITANFFRSNE